MHEYVVRQLERWKYRWPEVAEGAGISLRTLEKIARREVVNPRINTLQPLHDWLRANEQRAA